MESEQPDALASRVLRRAQVSKMTRALQSSLALANVKIKHGWENLSLDTIEPRLNQELSRKRPASCTDSFSDSSSILSAETNSVRGGLASSPLTLPMFSDDFDRSGGPGRSSAKRPRIGGGKMSTYPASSSKAGRKSRNAATVQSWKKAHSLPQSSPMYGSRHVNFAVNAGHISKLSFISETSTIPDDPPSPELSEDDDADLPVHSFGLQQSMIQSSPPRTPPPQRHLVHKESNVSWSRTPRNGEEGADLLMFLAASPTPQNGLRTQIHHIHPPSTPPPKHTPLPSSIMNTPGGSNNLFGLPNTPSNNFNFADFCNVTPSPAQPQWPKTPATAKTPLVVSSARRRLNFDNLLPPSASPGFAARDIPRKETGLGMDLGGELIS
ncbi:hypothetical protein K461DRAFT_319597 [Myriangium duriaei CBS 260.36]|uniref:Transcription factor Nrm1/Whi5 n=1 Tax=Myriangium duriaei CBS 260.36 TaxID=1168546 RepID=A0A9P4MJC1_9PEZI|nr:hypothetical protein K461DRAFT_319597 [Myriangium duriaei CBS 260.36]